MSQQAVIVTTDQRGVATLTLNRADIHNAFDENLIAQLTATFNNLARDKHVRVVILAAKGKSFSAGADINWMKRMASYSEKENLHDATQLATLLRTLNELPKPTIARVQGAAFGGGVGLVSCCDIAIASERASFCLSEVKLGLIPATISPYVISAIGERAARRYFTTAERFSAQSALQLGLISECVNEQALDSQIEKLLKNLLNNGPQAISAAKQLIQTVSKRTINNQLINETSQLIAKTRSTEEAKEGLSAFLEKRSPSWINSAV